MPLARNWVTDPARTLLVAVAFFGALAFAGWNAGVFDDLGRELTLVLASFAAGFAVLTVACDAELRGWLLRSLASRPRLRSAAVKSPAVKQAAS